MEEREALQPGAKGALQQPSADAGSSARAGAGAAAGARFGAGADEASSPFFASERQMSGASRPQVRGLFRLTLPPCSCRTSAPLSRPGLLAWVSTGGG